jgi:hypothetical protein
VNGARLGGGVDPDYRRRGVAEPVKPDETPRV